MHTFYHTRTALNRHCKWAIGQCSWPCFWSQKGGKSVISFRSPYDKRTRGRLGWNWSSLGSLEICKLFTSCCLGLNLGWFVGDELYEENYLLN